MLAASRSATSWEARTEQAGAACFGACGPHAIALTHGDGLLVALDGQVYNRDEFGTSRTDTDAVAELYRRHGFVDALRGLNGDFAVGYDLRTKRLLSDRLRRQRGPLGRGRMKAPGGELGRRSGGDIGFGGFGLMRS